MPGRIPPQAENTTNNKFRHFDEFFVEFFVMFLTYERWISLVTISDFEIIVVTVALVGRRFDSKNVSKIDAYEIPEKNSIGRSVPGSQQPKGAVKHCYRQAFIRCKMLQCFDRRARMPGKGVSNNVLFRKDALQSISRKISQAGRPLVRNWLKLQSLQNFDQWNS